MDYLKIYNELMARSKTRTLDGYTETHHIVPKCKGGSNDANNLAILTPSEHYLAHQLLVKIYPTDYGLVYAAKLMTGHKNGKRCNNKLYGWIRCKLSTARKEWLKDKSNHPRGMLGKRHSEETKRSNSIKNKQNALHLQRKIYCYALDGSFVREFECLNDAAKFVNAKSASNILYAARAAGIHKKRNGYQWSLERVDSMDVYVNTEIGKKWYNNATVEQKFHPGSQPIDWKLGRIQKPKE